MKLLMSIMLFSAAIAGTVSFAADAKRNQQRLTQTANAEDLDKAKTAFKASEQVETAINERVKAGYVLADEAEVVVVRGSCGIVGCDYHVLVVQRQSTKGANTSTGSVIAMVRVPAIGETTLKLIELKELD